MAAEDYDRVLRDLQQLADALPDVDYDDQRRRVEQVSDPDQRSLLLTCIEQGRLSDSMLRQLNLLGQFIVALSKRVDALERKASA